MSGRQKRQKFLFIFETLDFNRCMKPLTLETRTDPRTGLTSRQAALEPVNHVQDDVSKSYSDIFLQHTFTFFNILNFILAGLVLFTGSWKNATFIILVISNIAIGMYQEIRSKKVLDELAFLNQEKVQVIRNGEIITIPVDEIVLNDILVLKAGNQIPVDGVVVMGEGDVNESMLTGESDAIHKEPGTSVYAGCFLTAGSFRMQAAAVGEQTYMNSMLKQIRRTKQYPSQLRDSLDQIIKICTMILVPLGILLFAKTYWGSGETLNQSILATTASMVGMIPEGLIILTSVALAVSSVKLAQKKVLIQELYCIETLARVDVLCLDKTGTLTKGDMKVNAILPRADLDEKQLHQLLSNMYASSDDDNPTAQAIRDEVKDIQPQWTSDKNFPFSSSAKCSGIVYGDHTWYIGAYSFMTEKPDPAVEAEIEQYASQGIRVLALMEGPKADVLEKGDYRLLALILIEDILRPDARETLDFFREQGVQIKIISGDLPQTVAAIARHAGFEGRSVNMSKVEDDEIPLAVKRNAIFGRVTPDQKREMIAALKKEGHTVAMTGDGVNDVMALKEADCSIAMGSGSQAAKSIASLVLLENQFQALPSILDEGRRVINNIQRTASLFLVKTLFSVILTTLTILWLSRYPFEPIQLSLFSTVGVGVPAFILTLEPNYARVEGNFLVNVLSKAIPGALCLVLLIVGAKFLSFAMPLSEEQFSTICTWLAGINSLCVLRTVCVPLTPLRKVLLITMWAAYLIAVFFFRSFFSIVDLPFGWMMVVLASVFIIPALLKLLGKMKWKRNIVEALEAKKRLWS